MLSGPGQHLAAYGTISLGAQRLAHGFNDCSDLPLINNQRGRECERVAGRADNQSVVITIAKNLHGTGRWLAVDRLQLDGADQAEVTHVDDVRFVHQAVQRVLKRRNYDAPVALWMEGWVGARARPSGDGGGEPRLGLWLAWRPPIASRRLTLRVGVRSGPGSSVNEARFVGRHADTSLSAEIAYRIPLGDRFALQPGLGATVQRAVLDGLVADASARARVRRLNPSVDAALTAGVRLGELWLGARLEGSYLTRHQKYFVAGEPVFELSSTELQLGLVAAVPLY